MLQLKTDPVGIDVQIQRLQQFLYKSLSATWGIDPDSEAWACYGRCYKNKTENGYIAEVYAGKGEYKEVYWNDDVWSVSFFGLSDRIEFDVTNKAKVHLVFFVNVEKLKPAIVHRADEEIRKDVQNAIGAGLFGFQLDSIDLWLENVLREYTGSRRDERLKFVDMQPVHCFRINLTSSYNINNC